MSKLVESILENDLVLSQKIFEERISDIVEKKLYEKKRMMQAESFGMLKFTKSEIEAKKKAGYRKASDVLGDPAKTQLSTATKKYRKSVKRKNVNEMVDVQPDPEGRIRGGNSRPVKGTFKRKAAAAVLKTARKVGSAAGDVAVKLSRSKTALQAYKDERDNTKNSSSFPADIDYTKSAKDYSKYGKKVGSYLKGVAGRLASSAHETWE